MIFHQGAIRIERINAIACPKNIQKSRISLIKKLLIQPIKMIEFILHTHEKFTSPTQPDEKISLPIIKNQAVQKASFLKAQYALTESMPLLAQKKIKKRLLRLGNFLTGVGLQSQIPAIHLRD